MSIVSTYQTDVSKQYDVMAFDPTKPFNDLPPLPPNGDVETRRTLKACVDARVALAALQVAGNLIPNQAMLINSIPTLEAQASSEIENIVTTADRLFLYASNGDANADPATKEALNYRKALYVGSELLKRRPISTAMAATVCSIVKGVDLDVRKTPGTTLINQKTGAVIYTPPEGEARLCDMLANWEVYLHNVADVDPLIRMAVAHYQFEAIHPFTDGNGRTGRVLNLLFLIEQKLLDAPVLYLSRYIIEHRTDYYQLLSGVTTDQKWEDWICYMLAAVTDTARWTMAKIDAIRDLLDQTAERIRREAPRIYSRELAESIFVQPYSRIGILVEAGIGHRQSVSQYLKVLCEIGILEERKLGREKLFINPALLKILTDRA
jgi:Fic family protein